MNCNISVSFLTLGHLAGRATCTDNEYGTTVISVTLIYRNITSCPSVVDICTFSQSFPVNVLIVATPVAATVYCQLSFLVITSFSILVSVCVLLLLCLGNFNDLVPNVLFLIPSFCF